METIQILQQIPPATAMAALLTMPWAALAMLHAFGAASRGRHDDNWSKRAVAAVRWAGASIKPLQRQDIAAHQVTIARAAQRGHQFLPHAA
jgi:hypothetical protein